MNYSFHPHAEKELEENQDHYDNIPEGLGDKFRAEVEVADHPMTNQVPTTCVQCGVKGFKPGPPEVVHRTILISRILKLPRAWQPLSALTRRCRLKGFSQFRLIELDQTIFGNKITAE